MDNGIVYELPTFMRINEPTPTIASLQADATSPRQPNDIATNCLDQEHLKDAGPRGLVRRDNVGPSGAGTRRASNPGLSERHCTRLQEIIMADNMQDQEEHPATEMSTLLDEMLENLTTKVDQVGEEINAKLDEMSRRLDNLEASILSQTKEEPRQTS
ncbi:hypothetical protein MMC17_000050 [Xylographa soralifera]|nr:hypothetical protein [Xylographa soralifera]